MDNKDIRINYETGENKTKTIWRNIGIGVLAFVIAALTVLVIHL